MNIICLLLLSVSVSSSDLSFFAISDLHYDISYSPNYNYEYLCHKLPTQNTRSSQPFPTTDIQQIARFKCDSSYHLLCSTFYSMSMLNPNPDFILILGDSIAHSTMYMLNNTLHYNTDYNQQLVRLTYQKISEVISAYFPKSKIVPVIGNNDGYGDYTELTGNEKENYYQFMYDLWRPMVGEISSTFRENGYYSTQYRDIKFLCLNSNMMSVEENGLEKLVKKQFEWLEHELRNSVDKPKSVVVMMHIPPGVSMYDGSPNWHDSYIDSFLEVLRIYKHTIKLIMSGHLHISTFQLIDFLDIPIIVHSSISPIYHNNPTFRYYQISESNSTYFDYIFDMFSSDSDFKLQPSDFNSITSYSSYIAEMSSNSTSLLNFLIESKGMRFSYDNLKINEYEIWKVATNMNSNLYKTKAEKIVLCSMKHLKLADYSSCVSD